MEDYENGTDLSESREVSAAVNNVAKNVCKVKIGQRIRGLHVDSGELVCGKVVSRAGKTTGRNKNCFNIKSDSDGSINWVNLEELDECVMVPDEDESVLMFNSDEVIAAKEVEMQSWKDNNVFEEVDDVGQQTISVRWVITEKLKGNNTVTKARLVARGFEEDTELLRKDSPTCSIESAPLALSIAATKKWRIYTADVKSAYLQGDLIERELYLMPPQEYFTGKLWRLRKTVYGLCDAARSWYERVRSELMSLSVSVCSLDESIFYWYNGDHLEGIICLYVDDFLYFGSDEFRNRIIVRLEELFCIGSSASSSVKYVGLNIDGSPDKITVDQFMYASSMSPIKVSHERASSKSSELSVTEKTQYRALVGQLNWIATHMRPDIAFEVCHLSVSFSKATIDDLLRLNKLICYMNSSHLKLAFPKLEGEVFLDCYSDASFANLPDGGSQGGFIIFLSDSSHNRCPVLWQSRKVRRVVKSTLSAEALALLDCAEAAVYLQGILEQITHRCVKINCYVDNQSLADTVYSSKTLEDRRLRIDIAVLRDMIKKGEINSVSWVATARQLADCLTKRGANPSRLRAAVSAA